ncbi:O-antigen ligase family protein [Micromonospora sp. H33]|uniref:O-antigen ligase family protein n=1 Tax=Micromonospora sp. H33 TaxID=3452215 RepID=UPI003F89A617
MSKGVSHTAGKGSFGGNRCRVRAERLADQQWATANGVDQWNDLTANPALDFTALLAVAIGGCWALARGGLPATARAIGIAVPVALTTYFLGGFDHLRNAGWVDSLAGRFITPDGSDVLTHRPVAWQLTTDLLGARPAEGYGYAVTGSLFEAIRQSDFFDFPVNSVHNSYLQWLLELGVVGGPALLLVVAVCLWAVIRGRLAGIGAGLVWLVVAGLLVQTMESAMFGTGQPYPYVFWLGVAAVLAWTRHTESYHPHHRRPGAELPRPRTN